MKRMCSLIFASIGKLLKIHYYIYTVNDFESNIICFLPAGLHVLLEVPIDATSFIFGLQNFNKITDETMCTTATFFSFSIFLAGQLSISTSVQMSIQVHAGTASRHINRFFANGSVIGLAISDASTFLFFNSAQCVSFIYSFSSFNSSNSLSNFRIFSNCA